MLLINTPHSSSVYSPEFTQKCSRLGVRFFLGTAYELRTDFCLEDPLSQDLLPCQFGTSQISFSLQFIYLFIVNIIFYLVR